MNNQKYGDALSATALGIFQREAELIGPQGAGSVFDAHAGSVEVDGLKRRSFRHRLRIAEQPGFGFPLGVLEGIRSACGCSGARHPVSTLRRFVDHAQPRFERIASADAERPEVLWNRRGIGIKGLAGHPIDFLLDHRAISDPTYPVPIQRFDVSKPRPPEARIGDDDRPNAGRQQHPERQQKVPLNPASMLPRHRMDFLVNLQGETIDPDLRTQQLQRTIRAQIRPVDKDDRFASGTDQQVTQQSVDQPSLTLAVRIAEQSIDPLDAVPDEISAVQTSPELRGRQPTAAKGAANGRHQRSQPLRVIRRNRTSNEFLQHCNRLHGTVSVAGLVAQQQRYKRCHADLQVTVLT